MFLASKIGWAAIASALLATGILVRDLPRSAARSGSNNKRVAVFVVKSEITKIQETLRDKGHYRGKVDGVFGLQTRASLRAYQKAENLPITGQVDTRTAERLGVRPELTWGDSQSTGREVGHSSDGAGGEIKKDKPSAGIKWAKGSGRTSKTRRQAVKTVAAPESGRGDREKQLQAENENYPQ
ncbi:MAG: peptidoglycan-binding protein [Acidobacteriia bacterium]|nr:peptidoglycan-binding protein [Terriglobia bacterium]